MKFRKLTFQCLEQRWNPGACAPVDVLGAINAIERGDDPAQYDVDGNGAVEPLDVLLMINDVNRARHSGPVVLASTETRGTGVLFLNVGTSLGVCDTPAMLQIVVSGRSDNIRIVQKDGTVTLPTAFMQLGAKDVWLFEVVGHGRDTLRVLGGAEVGVSVAMIIG